MSEDKTTISEKTVTVEGFSEHRGPAQPIPTPTPKPAPQPPPALPPVVPTA